MSENSSFEKNIEKYEKYDANAAKIIKEIDAEKLQFFSTQPFELNLYYKTDKKTLFYHSPEGALQEAFQWYYSLNLEPYNILYIFGVGLGYFYEPLKEWLRKSPDRVLVFIEDDARVLKRFFETEKATELLSDPQVYIQLISELHKETAHSFQTTFINLFKAFSGKRGHYSTLPLYFEIRPQVCEEIRKQIFFGIKSNQIIEIEMMAGISDTLKNLFYKMLRMEDSRSFSALDGKLKGIPALIVGAGPSISKEIALIQEYHDKLLLIGSGTGANVLTKAGIFPHLVPGLDPTISQASRVRANFAFEVPVLYKMRFNEEAFKMHLGPKVFVRGFEGPINVKWFEENLGLNDHLAIPTGISTTNLAIEIAFRLGCNPIILIGVDMSYKDSKRYPETVSAHPGDAKHVKAEWGAKTETLFDYKRPDGKIIQTKTDWLIESMIITEFQEVHPEVTIINSTLEGLPIPQVKEMALREALSLYTKDDYIPKLTLHALLMRKPPLGAKKEKAAEALKSWQASLKEAIEILKEISSEIEALPLNEPSPLSNEAEMAEILKEKTSKLEALISFPDIKNLYQDILRSKLFARQKILRCHIDLFTKEEANELRKRIFVYKYEFYEDIAKRHLKVLEREIEAYEKAKGQLIPFSKKAKILEKAPYRYGSHFVDIEDKALDINLKSHFENELEVKEVFLEDTLFRRSHYLDGKLHGPTFFYGEKGDVLAEEWYFEGLREGKAFLYYPQGLPYAILQKVHDLDEGEQLYFYEDGRIRSRIHFQKGILDGLSEFYFPSGIKRREFNFKKGKQEGPENMWNEEGLLIFSGFFAEGKPTQESLSWHDNAVLAQKIIYSGFEKWQEWEWDKEGKLLNYQNFKEKGSEISHKTKLNMLKNEIRVLNELRGREKDERFL